MSPCTAKLNAFRNKQVGKYVTTQYRKRLLDSQARFTDMLLPRVKPKSLFAQASAKKLEGEALFGAKGSGAQS